MSNKLALIDNTLDFSLATQNEICLELGQRLKNQRLIKNLKQQDLADRAGVAVGTIKNLESKGQSSLNTFVRIVMALGLGQDIEPIFSLKMRSIAQMEKIDKLSAEKIPRRAR